MRHILAVTLFAMVLSSGIGHAQCADPNDDILRDRIWVKFRKANMSTALALMPREMKPTPKADSSGIRNVDQIVRQYGKSTISAPYSVYFYDQERWFQFRFDQPVDVEGLQAKLQVLEEVEAADLVYCIAMRPLRF